MITYTLDRSRPDVLEAMVNMTIQTKECVQRRKMLTKLLLVMMVMTVFEGYHVLSTHTYSVLTILIGALDVAFVLVRIFAKKIQARSIRKSYRSQRGALSGETKYQIDDSGVDIISGDAHSHDDWENFAACTQQGNFLFLCRRDGRIVLLDRTELPQEEQAELKKLTEEKIHA